MAPLPLRCGTKTEKVMSVPVAALTCCHDMLDAAMAAGDGEGVDGHRASSGAAPEKALTPIN